MAVGWLTLVDQAMAHGVSPRVELVGRIKNARQKRTRGALLVHGGA